MSTKNSIDVAVQDKIIHLIKALIPNARIYLFESRARETHAQWSDIDLAIDTGTKLSRFDIAEVKNVLEATNIPYKVDVVDIQSIPQKLRTRIAQEGIEWKN
jgi:predicted nucleotidyltransferase